MTNLYFLDLKHFNANIYRYKNCFFNKNESKAQAEATLLRLLKAEVALGPDLVHIRGAENEEVQVQPAAGLAGIFQQLREKGGNPQGPEGDIGGHHQSEEFFLQEYLNSKLETVSCLKHWETVDKECGNHRVKGAICRLARFVCVYMF